MASNTKLEIHKRRGTFLQPLNIEKKMSIGIQTHEGKVYDTQMLDAWENDTECNDAAQWPWIMPPRDDILHSPTGEDPTNETFEEKLARHKAFFRGDGLARGCDTLEDKRLTDLFYQRLLDDVTKQTEDADYRGLAQIISFWEDVRQQLNVENDIEEANEWPEGYPGEANDRLPSPGREIRTDLPRWSVFRIAPTRDEVGEIIDLYVNKTPNPEVNEDIVDVKNK